MKDVRSLQYVNLPLIGLRLDMRASLRLLNGHAAVEVGEFIRNLKRTLTQ